MPLFRKKPVVIEAVQFTDDGNAINAITVLAGKSIRVDYSLPNNAVLKIGTLKGTMTASPGDWIIKGINGEMYPCKPDIFEKTYEAVDESTSAAGR